MAEGPVTTGVQRMFDIEGRLFQAQAGRREDFDEHIFEDVHWLLSRCNQMWALLPGDLQTQFRDGPDDMTPAPNPPPWLRPGGN